MKPDKRIIIILVIIIAVLSAVLAYGMLFHDVEKNSNSTVNKTKTLNATLQNESAVSESGKYGYCAVCGKALTYEEANNEFTQGKVCHACANNPYYQSGEGAEYANKKLAEAYPDEYEGMFEDDDDDDGYDENYY